MSKRFCLILVIKAVVLLTCRSSDSNKSNQLQLKDHLGELAKINSAINGNNWSVFRESKAETETAFDLKRESKDTTARLIFYYYSDSSKYYIQSYTRKVNFKDSTYVLEMDSDTLYYYRVSSLKPNERLFFVGKYNYMFMKNMLNSGQRKYYYSNIDSLRGVRGNDLEPLPEID